VAAEQAMLRTFGRIMPVLMPLGGVLAIVLIVASRGERSLVVWLRGAEETLGGGQLIRSVCFSVPSGCWSYTGLLHASKKRLASSV
jgi:hypothetical protein